MWWIGRSAVVGGYNVLYRFLRIFFGFINKLRHDALLRNFFLLGDANDFFGSGDPGLDFSNRPGATSASRRQRRAF